MPPILQLDIQQIIAQSLGFLILLGVLKRCAWKPLLAMLDSRRARIDEAFRHIEQGKAELVKTQLELQMRLTKIEEEARAKIQEAIKDGRRIASEIQDEARAQAQQVIAKSKETVELELAKAKVTLRNDLADMTIEAVEDLLKRKLNGDVDRALVNSILEELGESMGPRV